MPPIGTCFRFYTQMRVEKTTKLLPIKLKTVYTTVSIYQGNKLSDLNLSLVSEELFYFWPKSLSSLGSDELFICHAFGIIYYRWILCISYSLILKKCNEATIVNWNFALNYRLYTDRNISDDSY